jgi:hypothetical protein
MCFNQRCVVVRKIFPFSSMMMVYGKPVSGGGVGLFFQSVSENWFGIGFRRTYCGMNAYGL